MVFVIDAVIERSDGQWCAFEIKLGANQIDAAAANLLSKSPPAFLAKMQGQKGVNTIY